MDPGTASLLFFGFLVASGLTAYEMRLALDPPRCAECPHCRARAIEKQRRQQELSDAYARRWHLGDHDEEERRR